MRYLGIDFGSKKIGLALSDEGGAMAFPHSVVPNDSEFMATVCKLIESEQVKAVVIGHSTDKDGNPNEIQTAIEVFMTDLTLQLGIPVHLENEVYSTQEAIRIQGRSDQTDAAAAAIILNSYLQKQP